jgi:hypothetical protein
MMLAKGENADEKMEKVIFLSAQSIFRSAFSIFASAGVREWGMCVLF